MNGKIVESQMADCPRPPPPKGCIRREGKRPSPPSRAPSLCPSAVSLTASASLNGICNRQ